MAQRRIGTKWQLVGFGWLVAGLLAFYTLGALWEYADTLESTNGWMLKIGFTACECAIFVWVWWHVWRNWHVTRIWCLVAATGMGIFLVVHASAVTKYIAAKKDAGHQSEKLAGGLAQIAGAASSGAKNRRAAAAAGQVGIANGKTLADAHLKLEDQAKNSTFLSPDYLNGKMFAVVFIFLLANVLITFLIFEFGKAEEDDDGDGIPNFADADSRYYNAKRAREWWGERGQLAPHELSQQSQSNAPQQPQQPEPVRQRQPITIGPSPSPLPQPATAQGPQASSTTFSTGGPPPNSPANRT